MLLKHIPVNADAIFFYAMWQTEVQSVQCCSVVNLTNFKYMSFLSTKHIILNVSNMRLNQMKVYYYFFALMNYNCIKAHFFPSFLNISVGMLQNAKMPIYLILFKAEMRLWECMDESVMPFVSPSVFMRVWATEFIFWHLYVCMRDKQK